LHKASDFDRVKKKGHSWAHPLVVLSTCPNDLSYSRFGFITSKRIGKAVARNRAKRLMREAIRLKRPAIKTGWDMVFIARKRTPHANYHQVDQAITELCRRANVLSGEDAQGSDLEE